MCSGLERELAELIQSNQIQARIDSHNKVLYARHADQRKATFQTALRTGWSCHPVVVLMLTRLSLPGRAELLDQGPPYHLRSQCSVSHQTSWLVPAKNPLGVWLQWQLLSSKAACWVLGLLQSQQLVGFLGCCGHSSLLGSRVVAVTAACWVLGLLQSQQLGRANRLLVFVLQQQLPSSRAFFWTFRLH